MRPRRFRVEWAQARGPLLVASEPAPEDLRLRAPALAVAYNDAHNSAMMANTIQFTERDVLEHYDAMAADGARQFFLYEAGAFAGDADLRNLAGGAGELAILIASREAQGKGLGTRFAMLLHAVAFRALGLERVYVTILPENAASRRLFEKLGYRVDTSPAARAFVDDERDVSMSIAKGEFERAHAGALGEIRIVEG